MILPQFIPYVQQGEIDNLPSFHFYIKIAALRPEEPFSGETMPVKVPDNPAMVQRIIEASRVHFAKEFVATASTFKPKAIPNKRAFKTKTNKKSEVFPD